MTKNFQKIIANELEILIRKNSNQNNNIIKLSELLPKYNRLPDISGIDISQISDLSNIDFSNVRIDEDQKQFIPKIIDQKEFDSLIDQCFYKKEGCETLKKLSQQNPFPLKKILIYHGYLPSLRNVKCDINLTTILTPDFFDFEGTEMPKWHKEMWHESKNARPEKKEVATASPAKEEKPEEKKIIQSNPSTKPIIKKRPKVNIDKEDLRKYVLMKNAQQKIM